MTGRRGEIFRLIEKGGILEAPGGPPPGDCIPWGGKGSGASEWTGAEGADPAKPG